MFLSQLYNIELAVTPMEQASGLMYRKEWTKESQGMLFVNQQPRRVSFWMKNTYLDMTIYYLDSEFNILEIHHPTPLDETGILSKSDKVQYILELNPKLETVVTKNWKKFKFLLMQNVALKQNDIQKLL